MLGYKQKYQKVVKALGLNLDEPLEVAVDRAAFLMREYWTGGDCKTSITHDIEKLKEERAKLKNEVHDLTEAQRHKIYIEVSKEIHQTKVVPMRWY